MVNEAKKWTSEISSAAIYNLFFHFKFICRMSGQFYDARTHCLYGSD